LTAGRVNSGARSPGRNVAMDITRIVYSNSAARREVVPEPPS
jgi:hypothetical protein